MSYYQHPNPDWRQPLPSGNAFASWGPLAWTIPNAAAGTETQSRGATTTTKGEMKTKTKAPNTVAEDTREAESEPESEAWHADNEADGLTPGSRLGSAAAQRPLATPKHETNSNTVAPAATTTTTTSDLDADMDEDDVVEGITPLTPAEAALLCKLQARTAMLVHDAPYGLAGNDIGGSVFGSLPAHAGYPSTEAPGSVHRPRLRDEAVEDMRTRGA